MGEEMYIDLEILAEMDDEYLVRVGKDVLNSLVSFDKSLIVRHWDGNKPAVLEPYGETAVRTKADAVCTNNLVNLPDVDIDELFLWLISEEEA